MEKSKAYTLKATVLRVIDGDTIEVRIDALFDIQVKKVVRLYGIDAPEVHSKIAENKTKAFDSKMWLKVKLEGKDVFLVSHKSKEKYGRYLAEIYLNDPEISREHSVNQEMITLGLAVAYFGDKKPTEI
jgi:micrococcal nuclease